MTTGWTATELAAASLAVFAVDPAGLGGVHVRGPAGPAREAWLGALRALLHDRPWCLLPASATLDRTLGGLDLALTLAKGTPVYTGGLLGQAHGGVLVVPGAERLTATLGGPIAAAMDNREVRVARDGFDVSEESSFGLVLLDEAEPDEVPAPAALLERCGLAVVLDGAHRPDGWATLERASMAEARRRLHRVEVHPEHVQRLVAAAQLLGVSSIRGAYLSVKALRVLAALGGRAHTEDDDLALAVALVLAPRATAWPVPDEAPPGEPAPPPEDGAEAEAPAPQGQVRDRLVESVRVALPPGLLDAGPARAAARQGAAGRGGPERKSVRHGRVVGSRPGDARRGRVDLLATLRAAAPWQRLRAPARDARLRIVKSDIRLRRLAQKVGRTLVFVVDASGSSALQRLHEAKGAVEILLAESYVRRDRIALITFRGTGAELAVPPTRSLARARRLLAGLPGGGGTPLAAALDAAAVLGASLARSGSRPMLVVLTDARANVARDGKGGRPGAERDALGAAAQIARQRLDAVLVDTSPRPNPFARTLAERMAARCIPLPVSSAGRVADAVRHAVHR